MLEPVNAEFRLGDRVVQPELNRIRGPDGIVEIEPKSMAVLVHLVEQGGRVVSADELIDSIWHGRPMGDNPVYKSVAKLRKALGDSPHHSRFIATVPKKGYRIVQMPHAVQRKASATAATSPVPARGVDETTDLMPAARSGPPPRFSPDSQPTRRRIWLILPIAAGAVLLLFAGLRNTADERAAGASPDANTAIADRAGDTAATASPVAPVAIDPGSVAVLVFDDLQGNATHPDVGDGVSDEVRTQLARVRGLSVVSRSASHDARERQLNPAQMREQLRVAYTVEGTLRVVDDRLHYTVQLIDTANGFQVWSTSATRDYGDVLTVQDEIAAAIVDALRIKLALDLTGPGSNTNSVAAWESFLRGRSFLGRSIEPEFLDAAQQHFEAALEHDPDYARAYAGLCDVLRRRYRRSGNALYFAQAETACQQAAQIDPQLSEVPLTLGELYRNRGRLEDAADSFKQAAALNANDFSSITGLAAVYAQMERDEEAEALYRQAIDRFPNLSTVHARYAVYLYRRGRYGDALPRYEEAFRLGATNAAIVTSMGACYFMLGDFEMAERKFSDSIRQRPSPNAHTNLGTTYFYLGRFEEAVAEYRAALALAPADHSLWSNLAAGLRQLPGSEREVLEVCRTAVELGDAELDVNPQDAEVLSRVASCRAVLGERDTARRAVEQAARLSPKETNVLFNCAVALVDLDDPVGAARMLERAIERGYPLAHARADPMLRPAMAHLQLP